MGVVEKKRMTKNKNKKVATILIVVYQIVKLNSRGEVWPTAIRLNEMSRFEYLYKNGWRRQADQPDNLKVEGDLNVPWQNTLCTHDRYEPKLVRVRRTFKV